jgi:hypothetical protein
MKPFHPPAGSPKHPPTMHRFLPPRFALALFSFVLSPFALTAAGPPPATIDFARDVRPLLERSCISCHGKEKQRGGLRLDDGVLALRGGNSGIVIKPGDGAGSRLVVLVAGQDADLKMPPGKARPLSSAEVALLKAWIDQGATWPRTGSAVAEAVHSDHWAFQPVRQPVPPTVRRSDWPRNQLDRFVLARLEKEHITPSPEADPVTLVRRVTLDLTGLPPTPEEVQAFLADRSPTAYEKAVERLLASPAYGERWARHWLDLARYADSDGYEKDTGRPHAWRYRHWVIAALNRDLPFDAFTVEQLAGDLLPGATIEQKVATGFHRNTLTNREGGVDPEQFRVEAVIDRVNTTARAFLGVTLGCAQCHDHKYDPFSQREYYQLFAFFNSDVEVDLPAPLPGFVEQKSEVKGQKSAGGTLAQTLALGPARATHVMIRGDFLRKGVAVEPGTPAVLPPLAARGKANRLDLARWIVDPANPLTARVLVNWTWHKYFGRGIVPTLEDFGTQGEKPSHPDLLDYLAGEVVRQGWSLKALHRAIVTSATYRQSSQIRPELQARDPYNSLLARQNRLRLEAETIRDVMLASSGLLTRTVGGPSVRPPQPAGISELTYAGSARWVESSGADRYRRGLYTWFQRTSPYPMLMTFDAPDSNLCCVRRERSNTPLQALTLLNDTVFVECARALAGRVIEEEKGGTAARLRYAFRLCVARSPTEREQARLERLFAELCELAERDPAGAGKLAGMSRPGTEASVAERAAWVALGRMLLNLDEVVTRE